MTDDIVTRLREHPLELLRCDCVRCLAADEIERLHAEINDLRLRLVALSIPKDIDRG